MTFKGIFRCRDAQLGSPTVQVETLTFSSQKSKQQLHLQSTTYRRKRNINTNDLHAVTGKDNVATRDHGNDERTTDAKGTDATHTGMKNLSVEDNYTTAP